MNPDDRPSAVLAVVLVCIGLATICVGIVLAFVLA